MLRDIWILMILVGFICLALSVVLFFIWKIPEVIDELSGRKAKRQIQAMRNFNSSTDSLDRFPTGDVYKNISSGSLISRELGNTEVKPVIEEITSGRVDEEEIVTSDLEESNPTSYLPENIEETSFLERGIMGVNSCSVKILEEMSSLVD